jgi:2-methylisocitrate lyase-like PEP mutase family enzyme
VLLTARCENLLHGVTDLDDTLARLVAYRSAGAHVVYAPGLTDLGQIRRVCAEAGAPVNALALPGGPTVAELADAGVRRVSVGGAITWAAYAGVVGAARLLLDEGVVNRAARLDAALAAAAFSMPSG